MRVTSLQMKNFRSFEDMNPISLGRMNILVGPNNAGKSSVLRALHLMQDGHSSPGPDVRVGVVSAQILIGLGDIQAGEFDMSESGTLIVNINSGDRISYGINRLRWSGVEGQPSAITHQLPDIDPKHFVVPYFSKRKPSGFHEDVRQQNAIRIFNDMSYLAAKLSRLANPGFPEYERYSTACKDILGFVVTAIPSANGQKPGVYLPNRETIPIEQMGEGVPNIVALLADLALSKGKLLLIEEPENDLHPKALKALLDLILLSSEYNQFVISTHSNIVVRHLASAEDSRLFNVTSEFGVLPPVATIQEVEPTVEARLGVLRDLGYSFSDFDLWDGWLILEESSAERIIRDYLIPWFTPKLSRVRTLAVGGVSEVEPTFKDFDRMVRFAHLEEAYRNAAWVRVDGDDYGTQTISMLKKNYPTWEPDRFGQFRQPQFERYYPAVFSEEIEAALSTKDRQVRRTAKKELLVKVRDWLDEDEERGRLALEVSAAEVIADLKQIESQLLS